MHFTKPTKVVGLDVGSHSVKAVQMSKSGGRLRVDDVGYALIDQAALHNDPISAQAAAAREATRRMPLAQCMVVGALPGQTVVIRYPRLRNIQSHEIDQAVEREAGSNIPYDLAEVFLDWSLLEEEGEGNDRQFKVLLVAAKRDVIDSRVQLSASAEFQYSVLSVDSLALADAAEGCDFLRVGETVALINIGATSASIHFTRDGVSNFIRDVSWGAKEMIQAISKAKRCDVKEAERILFNLEEHLQPALAAAAVEATPEMIGEASPPAPPMGGDASLLDPLDDELGGLGELGDPEPPMSDLDMPVTVNSQDVDLAEVLQQPIARLVSEVRRSFDYYEHQLYEKPVDRIILSGGVAHVPPIRQALKDDLGVEDVTVANPMESAVRVNTSNHDFERHPAQFMVAMGLAARGSAEL